MRTNITVEPDHLEEVARLVENADADYERTYQAIYQEVDKMSTIWQGKDNEAFTNQIKGYEDDFMEISIIMKQYAAFLRNTARAYRQAQEEIAAQAQRLNTA